MRARWQLLGAAVLVTATAVVSTTVAVRHADATDLRLRSAALSGVFLTLLPLSEGGSPGTGPLGYGVLVHNDGKAGVVLDRATWSGGPALDLSTALPAQADTMLVLPLPARCPAHRVTDGLDEVDVQVEVAGGRRTVRLDVPAPDQPREQVNARCQLAPAAQSLQLASQAVQVRPGHVVLDLTALATGSQPVEVLAVHAARGIVAQAVGALPLTLTPPGVAVVNPLLPHLLTVRLALGTCSMIDHTPPATVDGFQLIDSDPLAPPRYYEVQLDVRHPGEAIEHLNVGVPNDAANALVSSCHVPPLPTGPQG